VGCAASLTKTTLHAETGIFPIFNPHLKLFFSMSFQFFRLLLLLFLLPTTLPAQSYSREEKAIRGVMAQQEKDWNAGNVEAFMEGYWKSDSLKFISSRGVNLGWQTTLDGYKKGYPDRATMGHLTFTLIKVEVINKKNAFVIGKWHLKREKGDVGGYFTLFWKRIQGKWVIVADHTS
jgi:ketosteroid isomerase-like protein